MDVTGQLRAALAGPYEIDREIGAGGMATAYVARDIRHGRVALKVLRPELAAVLGSERFLSEIRVTANLQHPNLVPLFDSGESAGLLFYVMPYVEGESLRQRLDREKHVSIDETIRIATAVAGALGLRHRTRSDRGRARRNDRCRLGLEPRRRRNLRNHALALHWSFPPTRASTQPSSADRWPSRRMARCSYMSAILRRISICAASMT